jgi:hypothetical protein
MFEIVFSFNEKKWKDPLLASENDLRYNHLLGNLVFQTPEHKLVMNWGWIPLLDFAICVNAISKNLCQSTKSREIFDFTEADKKLDFERSHDRVYIRGSFSDTELDLDFSVFQKGVDQFYASLLNEIISKRKGMTKNYFFSQLLHQIQTN